MKFAPTIYAICFSFAEGNIGEERKKGFVKLRVISCVYSYRRKNEGDVQKKY